MMPACTYFWVTVEEWKLGSFELLYELGLHHDFRIIWQAKSVSTSASATNHKLASASVHVRSKSLRTHSHLQMILPCLLYAENVNNLWPRLLYYRTFNCGLSADLTVTLVALYLIRNLTSKSFPSEANRKFLWIESNCKSQVFKSLPGQIKSRELLNRDLI